MSEERHEHSANDEVHNSAENPRPAIVPMLDLHQLRESVPLPECTVNDVTKLSELDQPEMFLVQHAGLENGEQNSMGFSTLAERKDILREDKEVNSRPADNKREQKRSQNIKQLQSKQVSISENSASVLLAGPDANSPMQTEKGTEFNGIQMNNSSAFHEGSKVLESQPPIKASAKHSTNNKEAKKPDPLSSDTISAATSTKRSSSFTEDEKLQGSSTIESTSAIHDKGALVIKPEDYSYLNLVIASH